MPHRARVPLQPVSASAGSDRCANDGLILCDRKLAEKYKNVQKTSTSNKEILFAYNILFLLV